MRQRRGHPHPHKRTVRTEIQRFLYRHRVAIAVLIGILFFARLTNPFAIGSVVKEPFATRIDESGNIRLIPESQIELWTARTYKNFALLKSATHILTNVYSGSKKTKSREVEGIIDEIHELRFDPSYPYLISGDSFSVFYPRSLGIFYATALDPRTARSLLDWHNRQAMYLKSTAYALEVYSHAPALSTTIVPIGTKAVTLVNIYAYPSDTLYSLLYAINTMQDATVLSTLYPTTTKTDTKLVTQVEAAKLLEEYKEPLKRHVQQYKTMVFDSTTGLIKKDILLSGTKDIAKRQSAFYDNVIYWKTLQLASTLGLIDKNDQELAYLKKRIIQTYWLPAKGYFLEDQSDEAISNGYYSSDWLIALMTGFLNPKDRTDREYIARSIAYIQKEKLDVPFGLKYQQTNRSQREYPTVRLVAPEYGGTAIWSHWGIEYIKALILLSRETGERSYLDEANKQLESYSENIIKYRGYPEVYNDKGEMFSNFFYKSVRQTGWVVNFEEARLMLEDAEAK
ncbi:MAG: hypothetical protein ABI758_00040 [Candidatus Woesebacteria bacterium]